MKSKAIPLLIVIIALGAGAYFYFSANKSNKIIWRTMQVKKGNINVVVNTTGTIEPDTTVNVGTQVSGTLSKIFVNYNSRVKKGELIALIDTTTLAAQVDNAEATLKSAEAKLKLAEENYKRTKRLYDKDLSAKSTFDQDKVNLEVARSNVEVDRASLQSAKLDLNHAKIYAPINGVVLDRKVNVGQTVAARFNTPTLFTIADNLKKMQIQADIDEANIGQIKVGQPVNFTVDAFPEQIFKGKITQIRLNPTTVNNVVTYTVIINVNNPELKLKPGMTANIYVQIAHAKNVVKVPAMAFRFKPPQSYLKNLSGKSGQNQHHHKKFERTSYIKKNYSHKSSGSGFGNKQLNQPGNHVTLWIKKGNKIKSVHVTLGLSNGSYTAVKGNIKAGAKVVIGDAILGKNQLANNAFTGRRR